MSDRYTKRDNESIKSIRFDLDLISIGSTDSESESVRRPNSTFVRGHANDVSYETISDSVFSRRNSDSLDITKFYDEDTEVESLDDSSYRKSSSKKERAAVDNLDCRSECYSYIMDLIVEYDELSDSAEVVSIAPARVSPIKKRVGYPYEAPRSRSNSNNARTNTQAVPRANHQRTAQNSSSANFNKFEAAQPKSILKPTERDLSHVSNAFTGYNNDYTKVVEEPSAAAAVTQKKTLKYRVVVTRQNIIKSVKRLSIKRMSRKSMYNPHTGSTPKHNFFDAIKAVIGKTADSQDSTLSAPKSKITRSTSTGSAALTRLSGNYSRVHGKGPMKFQQVHPPLPNANQRTKSMPLGNNLNRNASAKQRIQLKTKSILVKDNATDLYNIYSVENPYLLFASDDAAEFNNSKREMTLTHTGINLNLSTTPNLERISGKNDAYRLKNESTLVKDEGTDTYTLSYDIIPQAKSAGPKKSQEIKPSKSNTSLGKNTNTKPLAGAVSAYKASQLKYSRVASSAIKHHSQKPQGKLRKLMENPTDSFHSDAFKAPPPNMTKQPLRQRAPRNDQKQKKPPRNFQVKGKATGMRAHQYKIRSVRPKNLMMTNPQTDMRKYFYA